MYSENIIKLIIEYLDNQDVTLICHNISITDKVTLNSACIELLSWLKLEKKRENWISEGRKVSLKPLDVNNNYEWCSLLKNLISKEPLFGDLFIIKDDLISFKESVPDEIKTQIRKDAFTMYNPPRFE